MVISSSSGLLFMSGEANLVVDDDDHQADDILNHSVVHRNFDTKIERRCARFFFLHLQLVAIIA